MTSLSRGLAYLSLVGAFALVGCDFLEDKPASTLVAALVVRTPSVSVPDRIEIATETSATVFVALLANPESTPDPVGDASVQILFDGRAVSVPPLTPSAGTYAQSSLTDGSLTYVDGADYLVEARIDGIAFGGTVEAPPTLTPGALMLSPSPTMAVAGLPDVMVHPAMTELNISWLQSFGRYSYVTVFRADPNNPNNPEVMFDNQPSDTSDILEFTSGEPRTSQRIPAETFADDGLYAVTLVTMDISDDLLSDTFDGSPILVGSGTAVLLAVGEI